MRLKRREDDGLETAISLAGGIDKLALVVGLAPGTVGNWRQVPLRHVEAIVTRWPAEITRADLRPDRFHKKG